MVWGMFHDTSKPNKGLELGKYVAGLETVDDQMQALFGAPLTEQAQDLVDFCRNDTNFTEYNAQLSEAYHAQDLDALERIIYDPEIGMSEEQTERLSNTRNRKWMDKITKTLPVQSALVVVGAAHLIGKQGLITLLRESGYTVEPVTTSNQVNQCL